MFLSEILHLTHFETFFNLFQFNKKKPKLMIRRIKHPFRLKPDVPQGDKISCRATQFLAKKISSHITYHWVRFYKKVFANLSKSPLLSLKWGLDNIPLGLFCFLELQRCKVAEVQSCGIALRWNSLFFRSFLFFYLRHATTLMLDNHYTGKFVRCKVKNLKTVFLPQRARIIIATDFTDLADYADFTDRSDSFLCSLR